MKFGNIGRVARLQIQKKKHLNKRQSIKNIGSYDFRKEEKLLYSQLIISINQGIRGFKTFQAVNIAPMFLFVSTCCLFAYEIWQH